MRKNGKMTDQCKQR